MNNNGKMIAIKKIDDTLKFMKANNLIFRGYMCGVANGLRLARSLITGEELIFERDEVQKKTRKDLDLFCEQYLWKLRN